MRSRLSLVLASTIAVAAVLAPQTTQSADRHPTLVEPAKPDAVSAQAAHLVAEMSTSEQAASIIMGHIPSIDPAALSTYMSDSTLGGFILMGANIPETESALQKVTSALRVDESLPPLVAIDQEGGYVSRLPWDDLAASAQLKERPPAETARAFAARASLVARAGATVNFGIVADTSTDRSSFIFGRSLGADPTAAAERVAAAVTAEEPFVASTLKHFPGHGAAPGDSHHLIPTTDVPLERWRQEDAVPFVSGIEAGASLLMFGHLAYTAVDSQPASLSPRWHEIAREQLGFDGVIVTDDLGMLLSTGIAEYADPVANAVTAVAAGNDLVLMIAHSTPETASQLIEGLVAAVDERTLPAERLQDAAERVMMLRLELAATSAVWAPCADCVPAP